MKKELWRNRWLSCINELTSLKLQKDSWLDKTNLNSHWSFVEFICSYFDDLGVDNNYDYQLKNDWISKNEFEKIKDWHELLDKYESPNNDDSNHKSILKDENWLAIVEEGLKTISELKKSLNKKEIEVLTEEVDYAKSN